MRKELKLNLDCVLYKMGKRETLEGFQDYITLLQQNKIVTPDLTCLKGLTIKGLVQQIIANELTNK